MSRRTPSQTARLRRILYVSSAQRRDNCAGCRHSSGVVYEHSLHCALTKSPVSSRAVCAGWKPIVRWVPTDAAPPDAQAPEPSKAVPAMRKLTQEPVALGPNSVFALGVA